MFEHLQGSAMSTELRQAIEKAQATQTSLVTATSRQGDFDKKELVKLRSQFQHDMLAISQIARSDAELKSDPAAYAEFSKRQRDMQDQLARHQAKWMLNDIERNREGYHDETAALREAQNSFFQWAKRVVRG